MVQFRAMDDLAETQAVLRRVIEVLREHAPDLVVEDLTSLHHRGGGRFTFAVLPSPAGPVRGGWSRSGWTRLPAGFRTGHSRAARVASPEVGDGQ
ncbi:hypothetical protein ABZ897_60975 [Nonomuraea sp. NPDC046802]|uniref:hypothetical protein n=1 Tax=Nonomuraea sp. NPDC046802 TaxID=3154919 RepID=UPI0033D2EFFA